MSSKPPSNITTTTKTELPPWAQEGASNMFNKGMWLGNSIYDGSFKIPTYNWEDAIAPWSDQQHQGKWWANEISNRNSQGMQSADAANQFARGAMGGQNQQRQVPTNPYADLQVQAGQNQYAGLDNPYLNEQIGRVQRDVVDAYKTGTASDLRRQAVRAGTYGGSGYDEAVARNESELAKRLGDVSSTMRMQDYGQQVGLEEAALGRNLDTMNRNLDRNAALRESQIGRQEQSYQGAQALAAQMAGLAPQLAGLDMSVMNALFGAGEKEQMQNQAIRDWQYQQWAQNAFPQLRGLEIMGNTIAGAIGNQGSVSGSGPMQGGSSNPYLQGLGMMGMIGQMGGRNGFGFWGG